MNILSLLSAMLATAFLIGAFYCLTRTRKSKLNVFSFLVLLCLGWWSFCNAFFFSSQTEAELWRWHHLAALGWTGFIAETTYYFIVLTGLDQKMRSLWMQLAFYALPTVLLAHNLFGSTTSLATGFARSRESGQWTYLNSVDNVWLWLYLACLVVYFGFSFYLLLRWSSSVKHRLKKRMAIGFVILDALTILLGFLSDVLLPLIAPLHPSVANLCTALFGAGYFFIILRFDLFNVHLVVSDREIIEHSMESILVTDEAGEILSCNPASAALFETERGQLVGRRFAELLERGDVPVGEEGEMKGVELVARTARGGRVRLLVSSAVIRDRVSEYVGTVISLRDITQISVLKEQYKIQSDEYHRLAFLDTLTGLPNRRKTFEELGRRAAAYGERQTDFFVLYMDVDHFKAVNDEHGHDVGDQFLKQIAARLGECVYGEITFLGRLSGDEFLMIGGPEASDRVGAECVKRIQKRFTGEFLIAGHRIESGVSVGFARYSDFGDVDAMVHHADEKMYRVKQRSHTRTRGSKPLS